MGDTDSECKFLFNQYNSLIIILLTDRPMNILSMDETQYYLSGMTAGGESDIGSVDGMMPEEVEAAYQVFIQYFSSRKFEYSCCKI